MADVDETINPEMVLVPLVPNEPALSRHCPNCHKQFKAHDQVFVSLGEEVMIHASCIVGLALVASLHNTPPLPTDKVHELLRHHLAETDV